ncbi:hypothetical protein [Vibrio sp. FJH11]
MLMDLIFKRGVNIVMGGVAILLATSAFAKDTVYFDGVTSLTINGVEETISNWLDDSGAPQHRNVTFKNTFVGTSNIKLTLKWSIDEGNGSPTQYSKTAAFSAETSNGVIVSPINVSPDACELIDKNSTCFLDISFDVPNTESAIQIKVNADTDKTGSGGLLNQSTFVNFTVIEQDISAIGTTLTVPDTQCFPYQTGEANLKAHLAETESSNPILAATLNYSIDGIYVGSESTGDNGYAYLSHNINSLEAGDHNLFVAYAGDGNFNPSDDSGIIGIYYNFVGFQPPINPAGNSIFGNGRVIPVKVKIVDANLNPVTEAEPTVWIYKWSEGTGLGEDFEPATSVSSADTKNIMRYDSDEQQYIYNADLSALTNGTYAIVIDPDDSRVCNSGPYQAIITVAKKGKKG